MNKSNYLAIGIIILAVIVGFILYPHLPDKVPSHWSAAGNVNGYSSPLIAVLLMPIISLVIFALLYFLPKLDPLRNNVDSFRKYYDGFLLMFVLFFFYVHLLILLFGVGYKFNFIAFLIPCFFFLFLYIGVMLKHTKRNYFIGIRTPWALQDDLNWEKTHTLGSKLFVIASFIGLLGLIFQKIAFLFIVVPIILSMIAVFVYSYVIYKKKIKNN